MRTIKTRQDLKALEEANALPESLLKYFQDEFQMFQEALSGLVDQTFDLYVHGYIVLLEPGDNVRDLREVGLNWVDRGLLGSLPEYVHRMTLDDGTEVYRIGVLYDNDFMMLFYSIVGSHDDEVEAWLEMEAEFGETMVK